MKVAAVVVAVLSLSACATDDESNGGGFLAGMRPAKPSLDNPNDSELPQNVDVSGNGIQSRGMIKIDDDLRASGVYAETIHDGHYPLPNEVCGGCEVTLVVNPVDIGSEVGEIDVMGDGGDRLCRIYLTDDGLNTTDCKR